MNSSASDRLTRSRSFTGHLGGGRSALRRMDNIGLLAWPGRTAHSVGTPASAIDLRGLRRAVSSAHSSPSWHSDPGLQL